MNASCGYNPGMDWPLFEDVEIVQAETHASLKCAINVDHMIHSRNEAYEASNKQDNAVRNCISNCN